MSHICFSFGMNVRDENVPIALVLANGLAVVKGSF
jgi:hypothetical protein